MPDHKCYIRPMTFSDEKRQEHATARFLFFDFETFVKEDGELVPNLAVVQYDDGEQKIFPSDGVIGPDVTDELCEFLFRKEHKGFYVIAHNFQSFDGMFILRWMLNNNVKNEPMLCGGKIKNIHVPEFNMFFRDSLAYVPTSLAKFPALVGLSDVSKGDFGHRFNRPENWNKVVPFPLPADFDYERKTDKDRDSFDTWYTEEVRQKGGLYDFNKEFINYCCQVNHLAVPARFSF